jgi:hypothetical protein
MYTTDGGAHWFKQRIVGSGGERPKQVRPGCLSKKRLSSNLSRSKWKDRDETLTRAGRKIQFRECGDRLKDSRCAP